METLETKEVRGLNFKFLLTGIVTIVSVTATVVMTYAGIINKIDGLVKDEDHKREMLQLEFRELKVRVDALELSINRMRRSDKDVDYDVNSEPQGK